jgi:hypothetical protein
MQTPQAGSDSYKATIAQQTPQDCTNRRGALGVHPLKHAFTQTTPNQIWRCFFVDVGATVLGRPLKTMRYNE